MPARGELLRGDNLELCAARHLFCNNTINGEEHLHAALSCKLQDATRMLHHLRFIEALPNAATRGNEEGVRNASAKDEQINFLD